MGFRCSTCQNAVLEKGATMSSARIYLLEGRPYDVFRALRVLSQDLQAGLSMGEQSLWVCVPQEGLGRLQEVLWDYDSLHMGELRDGAPYRDWARAQMEQKKNKQEGSVQGGQKTPSVAQKPAAQVVHLSSPEGYFFQPARDIQIDAAPPVFHFTEADPTGVTPPSGPRPPLEIISVPLRTSTGTRNGAPEKTEQKRGGRRVSRRPPDAEFRESLRTRGDKGTAQYYGVRITTVRYIWPIFVEGAQELIPNRGPGRKSAKPSAQAEEQASVV